MSTPLITISVVSHRQAELVGLLLKDIAARISEAIEVLVTINLPETLPFAAEQFGFKFELIRNESPKGFGANHNAAFRGCTTPYFCILNPDIRLSEDPFPQLLDTLQRSPGMGLVAPLIRNPAGQTEATSRRFPTPAFILRKALFGPPRIPDYPIGRTLLSPDWVGGMFMLVRSEAFRKIGGFDERYFMYYEDVDLCARLRCAGLDIALDPAASAIHEARRDSHRQARYLMWHLRSMLRFWLSESYASLRRTGA